MLPYMDPPGGLRTSLVPDVAFVSRERLDHVIPEERTIRSFSVDGVRVFGLNDRFTCEPFSWFAFDVVTIDV